MRVKTRIEIVLEKFAVFDDVQIAIDDIETIFHAPVMKKMMQKIQPLVPREHRIAFVMAQKLLGLAQDAEHHANGSKDLSSRAIALSNMQRYHRR